MKLREIAKTAQVSLTAVSMVLNGKAGVGTEKREEVERLLRENGYRLRPSCEEEPSSKNILFLKYSKHAYLVNGNPGFVTQIMDAMEKECRKHGYNLLITAFDDLGSAGPAELLQRESTKGAILLGTEVDNEDMAAFAGIDKPLVVVDNGLPTLPFSAITMNNRDAIFAAVGHLLELGHRRVGFLYNSIPSNNDRARRAAFEEAMAFYGRRFEPALVYSVFPTMDRSRASVAELLRQGVRFPTALVANNDCIAIGAVQAFKEQGLRIPEDISITGFDGLPFSAMSEPPLTTVNVPCGEIGSWAVHLLHEAVKGRSHASCKLLVGTELLVRSSTGPYHAPANLTFLLP